MLPTLMACPVSDDADDRHSHQDFLSDLNTYGQEDHGKICLRLASFIRPDHGFGEY